jgi:uncharacterized protein (DUF2164 family)
LSAFFTPRAVLDPAWMDYIGSFDLVLSYFYDPDELFLVNLRRCKPGEILTHSPRVPEDFGRPAARHFAGIVEPLGLALPDDVASDVFPTPTDADAARAFLNGLKPGTRLVAIHPGSGSETKNWPAESWAELGRRLTEAMPDVALLVVEGEADAAPAQAVVEAWKHLPHLRARLLPLPILAALLRESALFIGHDSGITHLAAASRRDLPIIALFGPTCAPSAAIPRCAISRWRTSSRLRLPCSNERDSYWTPMPIELDKQEEVVASLQRYFREELEEEISEMSAKFLLDYIFKEIAPFAYNKGVKDAETFFRGKIEDLSGTCFEDGLTYWVKKKQ